MMMGNASLAGLAFRFSSVSFLDSSSVVGVVAYFVLFEIIE